MTIEWVFAVVGLIGLLLFVLGLRRLRRIRLFTGTLQSLVGLALMVLAAAAFLVAPSLYSYHRFTHETAVAELNFKRSAPQQFRTLLTPAEGSSQVFEMQGDEWQLDARVLKWRGLGTLIGLDGIYRLERLSGRFRDLQRERQGPRSVHALARADDRWDIWTLAQRYNRWLPLVDAVYGSAAYLPMADGARFDVNLGTQGLIARPKNAAADRALRDWR